MFIIIHIVFVFQDVLRFWLEKGVDGFRGDAIRKLFESRDVYENENGILVKTVVNIDCIFQLKHT